MPKTNFSKSELIQLRDILIRSKMLPCDDIIVYHDSFNSGKFVYTSIRFAKGKEQLNVGMVAKTDPKTAPLRKQLKEYFGKEGILC